MSDSIAFFIFTFDRFQSNDAEHHEKLAVMIIDGALSLGDNPLAVSDEFNRRGITLAVVAVETPTYEIWDYYRTLAHYTGGEYMLLADAPAILGRVILSTINGEDTLRQAFCQMRIENILLRANRAHYMSEQNQITDDVGDLPFDHGLSE